MLPARGKTLADNLSVDVSIKQTLVKLQKSYQHSSTTVLNYSFAASANLSTTELEAGTGMILHYWKSWLIVCILLRVTVSKTYKFDIPLKSYISFSIQA